MFDRTSRWIVAGITGLALLAPLCAEASGSYRGRPSAPSSSANRDRYELGKKIFLGEFVGRASAADVVGQRELLAHLQAGLPADVRTRVDLVRLGGTLNEEEMAALRFFLLKRYKVR